MSRSARLGVALAASVAFHAGLFGLAGSRKRAPSVRAPDTALFEIQAIADRPAAPPRVSPPSPPSPPRPARPRVPNRPRARTPVRALAPRLAEPPNPVEAPTAAAPMPAPTAPATAPVSAHAPTITATPAIAPPPPVAPSGSGQPTLVDAPHSNAASGAPGSNALAQIQAILAARARRCYPAPAARLGLTGTAQIRFCVRDGVGADVTLAQGSGEPMLDRAAADCVVSGAPLPALDRCAVVPVKFERR